MIVAMPWPPPMHIVMSAVPLARALQLVERRAEQHGAGRAERVAEGDGAAVDVDALGVDAELARSSAARTVANASLISQRSMSRALHPRRARAPSRDAGAGAVSMMTGSAPTVAIARIARAA